MQAFAAMHERYGHGTFLAQVLPVVAPLGDYPPEVRERLAALAIAVVGLVTIVGWLID